MADEAGAGGAGAPATSTHQPTDDTPRTYSPDYDSIHAMGLIFGR
jgi:hypothetical protein